VTISSPATRAISSNAVAGRCWSVSTAYTTSTASVSQSVRIASTSPWWNVACAANSGKLSRITVSASGFTSIPANESNPARRNRSK
jgi:hypothetical protein